MTHLVHSFIDSPAVKSRWLLEFVFQQLDPEKIAKVVQYILFNYNLLLIT